TPGVSRGDEARLQVQEGLALLAQKRKREPPVREPFRTRRRFPLLKRGEVGERARVVAEPQLRACARGQDALFEISLRPEALRLLAEAQSLLGRPRCKLQARAQPLHARIRLVARAKVTRGLLVVTAIKVFFRDFFGCARLRDCTQE